LRYLLDTTTLIDVVRAHRPTTSSIQAHLGQPDSALYASAISRGELVRGALGNPEGRRERESRAVEELLGHLTGILPVTAETADAFGEITAYLDGRGQPIPSNDAWIAATAMEHGLIIVTTDAHFGRLPWLRVESWAEGPQI
jgi:predicted nucleic acid-binding protein